MKTEECRENKTREKMWLGEALLIAPLALPPCHNFSNDGSSQLKGPPEVGNQAGGVAGGGSRSGAGNGIFHEALSFAGG